MDSMRSLNTSLPGASPSKAESEPPQQILQAFKAAALSVTKLYQTAVADQGRARSEGYQDALDDLLAFLDKENIGLSDGEGWRIRRWATERLDGRESVAHESEDDAGDKATGRDGASSPEIPRSQSATRLPTTTARTASPAQVESSTALAANSTSPPSDSTNAIPPQTAFTFRSNQQLPDSEMILSDVPSDLSDHREGSHGPSPSAIPITRPRAYQRHNSHSHTARQNPRSAASLGTGAGQKRKINLSDVAAYFDIPNFGNGKDTFGGGGKRGRYL